MTKFNFHTIENASGEAKELLERIKKSYGFIPNLFAYMAEAPVTIDAYLQLNQLVEKTSFTPGQQQVALLAVSTENQCGFCTVAHRAIGRAKKANQQTLDALGSGASIEDPKDRALSTFVRLVTKNRGRVSEQDTETFLNAGFTRQQLLEVMLIVAIKTLSNYTNHFTGTQPNPELLAGAGVK